MINKLMIVVLYCILIAFGSIVLSAILCQVTSPNKADAPYFLIDTDYNRKGRVAVVVPVGDIWFKDYTCDGDKLILHGAYYPSGLITTYNPDDYIVRIPRVKTLPQCAHEFDIKVR
jgi:hypothetical protein